MSVTEQDQRRSKTQLIELELRGLAARAGGMLAPASVVEFARDPKTALHSQFTWDDTDAAEAWRLHEARNIIRVHVTVLHADSEPVRVFTSLRPDRESNSGYRLTVDVLSNDDLRAQMLADAKAELQATKRKYHNLQELSSVWDAIEQAS